MRFLCSVRFTISSFLILCDFQWPGRIVAQNERHSGAFRVSALHSVCSHSGLPPGVSSEGFGVSLCNAIWYASHPLALPQVGQCGLLCPRLYLSIHAVRVVFRTYPLFRRCGRRLYTALRTTSQCRSKQRSGADRGAKCLAGHRPKGAAISGVRYFYTVFLPLVIKYTSPHITFKIEQFPKRS